MIAKDFRTMSDAELTKKMKDLKEELFNLRFSHSNGSLSNPLAINVCKKDIAKVSTIIRERELGISKAPVAVKKVAEKKVATEKVEEDKPTKTPTKKPTTKTTATNSAKKLETKKATPSKGKAEKILV